MTEIYGLFDAADPEAPDRVYTSEAFARLFRTIMRDGIVHNDGDELAVSPSVPAAMSVDVGTGMALVQGRYYINDADLTLTVEAADPSYPRIDRVVVRADLVGRTVHVVVKKGTAAASPVPPALTRTAETWELSLAQVRVEAGATSILSAKIADERGNASLCGVAAPAYVPSSQLEVVAPVNMQGKALTGLPVPSAATDAARKGYVDSELAAKIGGFGISQIAIDADKNWGGKNITNIGQVSANSYTSPKSKLYPIISDAIPKTIRKTLSGSRTYKGTIDLGAFNIPQEYIDGSIIGVSGSVTVIQWQSYTCSASLIIYVNGDVKKRFTASAYGGWKTITENFIDHVPIKGGDVISVLVSGQPAGSQYDIMRCSGTITFFGEDVFPSVIYHPNWI